MGIDCFEQAMRKLWKLGVELDLYACGKIREPLQQPFDKRIGAGLFRFAIQRQAAGDLGELPGKFGGRFA